MSQLVPAVLSFVGANAAAAVVSTQTNDYGFSTFVGGITLAIGATCTGIVFVSPMIAKAIREGFPPIIAALNDLRKQLEETRKSTYTGQIDELKEMISDLKQDLGDARDREARLDDSLQHARKSLHEIRDSLSTDILARDVKIQELEVARDAKFHEFEEEIKRLRLEIERLSALLAERADAQDKRIDDNTADIKALEERAGDAA